MRILYFFIAATIFNIQTSIAKTNNKAQSSDSIILKAKKLKELYILSTASSDGINDVYKKQFFNEFPTTFKEFNNLYGYNTNKLAILYSDAENHILKLFNNLQDINDTLYYRKIISIAIDGNWDGDAVNYFQTGLRKRVEINPELIAYVLQSRSEKEIKSFWHFYFDGPHPKKQIAAALLKLKSIDANIYTIMTKTHQEILDQPKE